MILARQILRPAVQLARELQTRSDLVFQTGRGPLIAFFPAYGRHGAALLRIYEVARALRQQGWRSLILPCKLTLNQRRRILDAIRPDLIVMQGARHDLNRPALYPGHKILFDMDDADFHLPHLADPVSRAMAEVGGVIAGSEYIADWCRGKGARADVIWTGTPISKSPTPPHERRPPVIAWAQTAPETYVDEAEMVLRIMREVASHRPQVRLRLYDRQPTDGTAFLERFRSAGIQTEWAPSVGYGDYLASFNDVSLGLAPLCGTAPFCRGKSFGKVLAYFDRRVPVIASDAGEHGRFFAVTTGVMSNDREVWVAEILRLLDDAAARQDMADAAYERFRQCFAIDVIARQTGQVLRSYLS